MVDGLDYLWGKIYHIRVIVALEAEFYSCNWLHFVGLLQQDDQLSDDVVYSRADFAEADDICSYCLRIEILSCSWTSTHEFLLGLDALPRSEDAVLNYKLAWFYECLRHQKWLPWMALYFFGDEWAMIGFGVVKLQVNDKIIDLDKRADYSRHKFKLL